MFPGILPRIPNLQVGYLYNFGQNVRSGRFTADYLLPFGLSNNSTVYGEAHTEFQSFWKTNNGFNNRVDVSLGGGYRTILRDNTLVGVNGFYDTSRLGEKWYSSGSVGLEMAALVSGQDAFDLNFNWYGQLFNGNVIRNAFRYGPSNFDVEAGYSHELWQGGPDLRLKLTGYQFDTGTRIGGWNAGGELKSRDGVFCLKYEVGNDRINDTYQTVAGFVNVGFRMDNILRGESPFELPEPIFKSPRNLLRLLTRNATRNWHQPAAAMILSQSYRSGGSGNSPWNGVYAASLPPIRSTDNSSVYYFNVSPSYAFDARSPAPLSYTLSWTGLNASLSMFVLYIIVADPDNPGRVVQYDDPVGLTLTAPFGSVTRQFTGRTPNQDPTAFDWRKANRVLFAFPTVPPSFTGGSLTIRIGP